MRIYNVAVAVAISGFLAAEQTEAATFSVFDAGTMTALGTFDAPTAGGLLTAASLSVFGGVFDVLGCGTSAPVFDALQLDVDGNGGQFGSIFNSVAFNTVDVNANPILCGVGDCVFSFDGIFGVTPGEWYVDYVPGGVGVAAIGTGFYQISPATIPLPASGVFILTAWAALLVMANRPKRTA